MEKEKIDRINFLARKSKTEELTPEEKAEQKILRDEYIAEIRYSFGQTLESTVIQYPDGTRKRVRRNEDKK